MLECSVKRKGDWKARKGSVACKTVAIKEIQRDGEILKAQSMDWKYAYRARKVHLIDVS